MLWLFSFKGKVTPLPYALLSVGVFFSQQVVIRLAAGPRAQLSWSDPLIYLSPLRSLVTVSRGSDLPQTVGLAYLLIAAWVLAALAFRRANDANVGGWVAAFAITPAIQIPVILFLCLAPSGREQLVAYPGPTEPISILASAVRGVLAGVGLTLVAVALGTLVFGTYGYALFLLTPFVIGIISAYIANYRVDIGRGQTAWAVVMAAMLGSLTLVAFAVEGLICIIMAAPLGIGMALIGGDLGRAMALQARRPARQTLPCLALLPLLFSVENVLPPSAHFDTEQTIAVAAPPEAVWKSILSTDPIEGPLALPFRLGVAYPLRGEVIGEGVGAVRYGEFSTGTAIERMTEWVPNRKLAFEVVRDIPGMRELSPYEHVHAPHVIGYFRTISTSFELVPRPDGGTDIIERTAHELRLDPVPYWLPMAQWIVRQNNARVLAHIRTHAEQGFRAPNSAAPPPL